jgi:Chagasin family peptidase inhibitor I42
MLRRRWWIFVPAVVVVVGMAGFLALRAVQRARYGDVHTDGTSTVAVHRGHRFSLAVPDRGASVGDHWTVSAGPDGAVALVRSQLIAGNVVDRVLGPATGGGGGTRYFVFDARRAGTVTISLRNCFQGCHDERTRAASRDVTWTVSVR